MAETKGFFLELLNGKDIKRRLAELISLAIGAISFACAVGVHQLLSLLAWLCLNSKFPRLLVFLDYVFAVAFAVIYVQLAFDMVQIYVPWLTPRQKPVIETSADYVKSDESENPKP